MERHRRSIRVRRAGCREAHDVFLLLALIPALAFAGCGERKSVSSVGTARPSPRSDAVEGRNEPRFPEEVAAEYTPSPRGGDTVSTSSRNDAYDPALLILDATLLASLETKGLAFVRVMDGAGENNAELHRTSALYRDLVAGIELDDAVVRERDPTIGVGLRHAHRAFDTRWLRSTLARFELVGVVNRIDRRHVDPRTCGEVRFVYRLGYRMALASSRLPMTVNVVAKQVGDCAEIARAWLARSGKEPNAAELLEGPLAHRGPVERIEINFQSTRYPSGVRPDLGGHAEYVLRVFRVEGSSLVRAPLENTPTVRLSGADLAELRRYLRANAEAIDRGTLVLPDRFLAERSVSAAPRGSARLTNRPYAQVFARAALVFPAAALEKHDLARTDVAMLRRLETMSCKGCHQARSLAGFHLLGEERDPASRWNALAVGASPHLLAELPYRRAVLEAIAEGDVSLPSRPFAERGSTSGRWGDACGIGGRGFDGWSCDAGLRCADDDGDAVGVCVREGPPKPGESTERGVLRTESDPHRDRFVVRVHESCDPLREREKLGAARSKNGFPAGMCHERCERYGERDGDQVCGPVPFDGGQLFNGLHDCLGRLRRTFAECIADSSQPTWLRLCDAHRPCREDYLCARVEGLPENQGACLPPYFLAQLRVDGHDL